MDLQASIAVTGAGGFIGAHLIGRLRDEGCTPILITRSAGFDICEPESLLHVPKFDVLVHLAARTFVPNSRTATDNFFQVNVSGTLNLLELCKRNNARIVFLSSYVYGNPEGLPIDESHPTTHWNPYASSKLIGEEICRAFFDNFGIPTVVFRLFNVYGPGQNESFLIPKIVAGAKRGKIALMSSKPRRDFVHVIDVVDAIIRSLGKKDGFSTFNVGSGISYSVREIVDMITATVPCKNIHYTESQRPGEVMDVAADYGFIHRTFGWSPTIDFPAGLKQLALSDA